MKIAKNLVPKSPAIEIYLEKKYEKKRNNEKNMKKVENRKKIEN